MRPTPTRGRATKAVAKNSTESGLSLRLDELTERISDIACCWQADGARVAALEDIRRWS